jgi:hypothetical protein
MRTALAAVRKTTTDDHEFVHRRFVENALHPGASDRRAIFSFKLICRNLAAWSGFFIAPSPLHQFIQN